MYTSKNIYIYIYTHVYVYIYRYTHVYIYTSIHIYHICICTYIHVYMYTHMHVYIYIYIYIYTYLVGPGNSLDGSVAFQSVTFPLRFRQRFRNVSVVHVQRFRQKFPLRFRGAGVCPTETIQKTPQRFQGSQDSLLPKGIRNISRNYYDHYYYYCY